MILNKDTDLLRPSKANGWYYCGAYHRMTKNEPDSSSSATEQGSVVHELAEACLTEGTNIEEMIGKTLPSYPNTVIDEEMVRHATLYVNHVNSLDGEKYIEQQVHYDKWSKGGKGTADCVVVNGDELTIIDLKFGRVPVDAEFLIQIMLYALGFIHDFGHQYTINTIKLVIFQTRIGNISEWEMSFDELMEWANNDLKPRAELALTDDAPFNPGTKQCMFCPAQGKCKALANYLLNAANDDFEDLERIGTLMETDTLTNEDYSHILPKLDLLRRWSDAVKAESVKRVQTGQTIENFKPVEGYSKRLWRNEEDARKQLEVLPEFQEHELFDKKLLTPAKAEKILGKNHPLLEQLIVKPQGKMTLAPLSDRRPELNLDPTDGFDAT